MKVVMNFTTLLSAQMMDQLLDAECRKGRNVRFHGLEVTAEGTRKSVSIEFEHPADRDRFRNAYNALNRSGEVQAPSAQRPKQSAASTKKPSNFFGSFTASLFGRDRQPQRRPGR